MFGRRRKDHKQQEQNAKIRAMLELHPDKLAALCWDKDQDVAAMAQAVIVVEWLAEHGYLPGKPKTKDH